MPEALVTDETNALCEAGDAALREAARKLNASAKERDVEEADYLIAQAKAAIARAETYGRIYQEIP